MVARNPLQEQQMKHTRNYKWGALTLHCDMTRASSAIGYQIDGEDMRVTPFQAADARHGWSAAFALVNKWLKGQWI
jgi:hypothetical protein